MRLSLMHAVVGWEFGWEKRNRKFLSFLFSTPRSQLPSVKYVYAVDYKSMIGGYRTLLVMNSENPLLIPLRYLSLVWVTSHKYRAPLLNTWQSAQFNSWPFSRSRLRSAAVIRWACSDVETVKTKNMNRHVKTGVVAVLSVLCFHYCCTVAAGAGVRNWP
jgi:hypothetical protein